MKTKDRQKRNIPANDKGFTLVEAVLGVAILTIIVASIYVGFVIGGKAFTQGNDIEETGQEAFSQLEMAGDNTSPRKASISLSLDNDTLEFEGTYRTAGELSNFESFKDFQ